MTVVAIVGNSCTTTALALAATWPTSGESLLAELDPTGGDLSAWLDLPQDPGLASAVSAAANGSWPTIQQQLKAGPASTKVLTAPLRSLEAGAAVREAATRLVPTLAAIDDLTVLADCGRQAPSDLSPIVKQSTLTIVTVRQTTTSWRAAAAHLDRTAELVDAVSQRGISIAVAVIGNEPYDSTEIGRFLAGTGNAFLTVSICDDPAAASLLAGRPGSQRQPARSRLLRSAKRAAAELSTWLEVVRTQTAGRDAA